MKRQTFDMNNFWQNKNIFITGATGLVGYHLTKSLLGMGARVIILLRDGNPQSEFFRSGLFHSVNVVKGELENLSCLQRALNKYEVDSVFHLGAQAIVGSAIRRPMACFESNIRGTYNLLEACREQGDQIHRIIIASSDKSYGSTNTLPYTENTPLNGRHPYDVSKSCADLLSYSYYSTYSLPIGIARCGNIYGEGDLNWSRLIPGTILDLYRGKAPKVRSNGLYTRDYLFIEDAVRAYLLLGSSIEKPEVQGEAFNFGSNTPLNVLEVIKAIQKVMNREDLQPLISDTAEGEIQSQSLDITKAKSNLGWEPQHSFLDGISKTVEWYENYFQSFSQENLCLL